MRSVGHFKPKLPGRIMINGDALSAGFKAGEPNLSLRRALYAATGWRRLVV
jgi:hypothetical protein